MEIKFLKKTKEIAELQLDNLTVIEVLRAYLNKQPEVKFAAWKREHPTKKPVLKIKTKGKTTDKALKDAISQIEKDSDKLLKEFKKAK